MLIFNLGSSIRKREFEQGKYIFPLQTKKLKQLHNEVLTLQSSLNGINYELYQKHEEYSHLEAKLSHPVFSCLSNIFPEEIVELCFKLTNECVCVSDYSHIYCRLTQCILHAKPPIEYTFEICPALVAESFNACSFANLTTFNFLGIDFMEVLQSWIQQFKSDKQFTITKTVRKKMPIKVKTNYYTLQLVTYRYDHYQIRILLQNEIVVYTTVKRKL